ncbi:hypothetical protein ACHAW5_008077 [Stephanodiscus triporus]|uniref:SCP domain-containing protein n=1 Tax=Stephanodiscus triporus TaxID=2934178 RepID=A0ABD3PTT9_9STRA
MNCLCSTLLLVATTFLLASAKNVDNAESPGGIPSKSMLRKSDPDQFLQLVALKESNRDVSIPTAISIGSWETIESINEDERALGTESAASDCGSNKKYFKLDIRTDNYGFETSWILAKKQSNTLEKVASGPPSGTNYRDNNMYIGGYCLSAGTYKFTIKDKFRDGMNSGSGGSYTGYVGGMKKFGSPSDESEWSQRVHEFTISSGFSNSAQQFTPKIDMTDMDEQWLHAHNKRRKEWHTRYGKSYVPLIWSNVLKAQAKAYAQDLLSTCGDGLVHDKTEYGENLASNFGEGSWASLREPEDILIRWVDNEADVGWPGNAHLTQVLWRATEYVGCEVASKSWNDGVCHIQVCRYARPGNCNMGAYKSNQGDQKWLEPMLNDDSPCLPECPPDADC